MRRSICYCEPNMALAGEISNWKFSYSTATNLPKGTRLKFDLLTKGRDIDWQIPQVNFKEKKNLIYLEMPGGKTIPAREIDSEDSFAPLYEFQLTSEVKAGETVTIIIGSPDKDKAEQEIKGNRAQANVQRRRPFHLFIDPKGKGDYKEPEVF